MDSIATLGQYAFNGVLLLLGYLLKRTVDANDSRIEDNRNRIDELERSSEDFRLSNKDIYLKMEQFSNFANQTFAPRLEMQQSLARVHEQIEKNGDKTEELGHLIVQRIDALRNEVKGDMNNLRKAN
jgi:DNA anti-recombination protein RmuC